MNAFKWAVFLAVAVFLERSERAQDYVPNPIPGVLVVDSDTTFLVDLAQRKDQADFARGNAQLSVDPAAFRQGIGYAGKFSFSTGLNLPSTAWTMEMILRFPAASGMARPVLGGWKSSDGLFSCSWFLGAWGVQQGLQSYNSRDSLQIQPFAGGNGRSIQANATDKWIYIAFGCDFAARKCMTMARDLAGNILNEDMNFAPTASLDTAFLSSFPPDQQDAELKRRWQVTGEHFARSMPTTISIGDALVEIRSMRLSKRYRTELFELAPRLPQPSSTEWTPNSIDATKAKTQTVVRSLGYSGYGNFRNVPVTEAYLPLASGDPAITLKIPNLPVGLYSLFIHGTVDSRGRASLPRVWLPCPMEFHAQSSSGTRIASGRMLLKQSFVPRRMQGFHFHVDQPGDVTATFRISADAQEICWIQHIALVDQLGSLPDVAIKKTQNFASGASSQLTSLTNERKVRDDAIWNALPPLNTPLQVLGQVEQFLDSPPGVLADPWVTKAFQNVQPWYLPDHTFDPWDFLNLQTGEILSHARILAGEPWPGGHPDSGVGVFFRRSEYPSLATDIYNTKRAELLGQRYLLFAGAIMNSRGSLAGLQLPLKYFTNGDPNTGHDAAMALVRWAYDWPALEMSLHETRLCTHSPDFEYNTDWSSETIRNGKMYYNGWSGDHAKWLFEAYDQVFPYIERNQVFADAVHRFIPWVSSPGDVIRFLDRYLVWSSVRDVQRGLIPTSVGIEDAAGILLGPDPLTTPLFDLTRQSVSIYPASGTYQEMYGTALSRSGVYYIASFMTYGFGSAQETLIKAHRIKTARANGVPITMDLSDVNAYPKVRSAGDFLLNMWVAGGFPFMVGDASGGPHSRLEATGRLLMAKDAVTQAFDLYGDPRHAWVLKNVLGSTDPSVAAAAATVRDPVVKNVSRVVPDFGAVVELSPDEGDIVKKTSATLRLGVGQGHAHHDYLDLNLFGMGLPLAVDLACRNEGNFWSRPGAGWSFLHNHALAHSSNDPNGAGTQSGEPWLRAFAPPLLRASYADQSGAVQLHRDVLFMEVGTGTGTFYAFDVQRLRGDLYHTWAFHGCESESLELNVPMENQPVRWTDRTLEGTQKLGRSTDALRATWTMTRRTNSINYIFSGGGTLKTVACEPTVLGSRYDSSLPEVRVRATLLGRGSDAVMQGNPYSDAYSYCFPFLWVQSTNETESVYPAVYEWFRGSNPVIAQTRLIQKDPLQVRVITSSGQVDDYEFTPQSCSAISRDALGIRWVKLSGARGISLSDLSLHPTADYNVTITSLDYATRTLTTSGGLPSNPGVVAGNDGRRIFLRLRGSATSFTWDDDLLVQEGQVTSRRITGTDSIELTSNQQVLFAGMGNRKAEAMTVITEDGKWHFRGGKVINRPPGVALTADVFTDHNGDGFVNMKTYEVGIGDQISLPADVTVERGDGSWRVKTNIALTGNVQGTAIKLEPSESWQVVPNDPAARLLPASELKVQTQ